MEDSAVCSHTYEISRAEVFATAGHQHKNKTETLLSYNTYWLRMQLKPHVRAVLHSMPRSATPSCSVALLLRSRVLPVQLAWPAAILTIFFSWFTSVSPGKSGTINQIGHDRFLPHPFQFTVSLWHLPMSPVLCAALETHNNNQILSSPLHCAQTEARIPMGHLLNAVRTVKVTASRATYNVNKHKMRRMRSLHWAKGDLYWHTVYYCVLMQSSSA
jgi:hypothetical protein